MPFKKGQSGNPNGRLPGTKTQKVKQWEELGDYIRNQGADRAMKILMAAEDKDFLYLFDRLLEYFQPKLNRSDVNLTGDINPIHINYSPIGKDRTGK